MSAEDVPGWALRLRSKRRERGWSQRDMAKALAEAAADLSRICLPARETIIRRIKSWEAGEHQPKDPYRLLYCRVFSTSEAELFGDDSADDDNGVIHDDEIAAMDLARRVGGSDVSEETLLRLEAAFDDLAVAYQGTPPTELLDRVRRHLTYVARLLDARKTLVEHRRLLVVGGWLSLLAATCNIDLHRFPAARAQLRTAAQLAKQAEYPEILAWCMETEAWQALTDGDYRRAVTLSRTAQRVAPHGGSAYIQATAQEGRAWARLEAVRETHDAIQRVDRLVSTLPMPERPEHHYRYDPAKGDAYKATALSWLGDSAAEQYARQVLARMESPEEGPPRPRRAMSARLDLALALMASDQIDEAGHLTLTAVTSGILVPSNYWRAAEVIDTLEARRVPEAVELREVYRELCAPQGNAGF
ncbi:hypothetical protein [Streptosporangium sp. NPDC051022]|uniref:hypothetical protein n=1 Tax=Streptosporangium sp. NPDC051022 TaxID=3155752 RepID=UPI00341E298A